MHREQGLYVHIPFCHARCGYCDFVTLTGKEDQIDRYVDALCDEIRLYSVQDTEHRALSTVFFGGGTPSVLEARHVEQLLNAVRDDFHLQPDAEVTLEANPETITFENAQG